jgi:transposase
MLSFTGALKVFLAVEPCDLRKSFNGLHAVVTETLGEDPRGGALFVFTNRRRTRLKILFFDGTGLWVCTKRLEEGTFSWPRSVEPGTTKISLTPEALSMLTDCARSSTPDQSSGTRAGVESSATGERAAPSKD